jgi:RNA polymerase sigma-70 factor, ECF subfamily
MRGDDVADAAAEFDLFYRRTADSVLRQMVMVTGDLAEAEDVVQEAFERAWLRWRQVHDSAYPEAWVRTVAHRLAVSRWRRLRNASAAWLRLGPPAAPPEIDSEHIALMAGLLLLPAKQRVAIVLHHLADLPVNQVAEETGASVSAVKQQLSRGRAALAGFLGDDWTDEPGLDVVSDGDLRRGHR